MPTSTEFFGYPLTNLGPLTTTYEPPASCTAATTDHIYYANASDFNTQYGPVSCGPEKMSDCYPSGSDYDKINSQNLKNGGHPAIDYFSPGVVCPKGWTTAGVFAQGDEGTKGGIFTQGPSIPDDQLGPEDIWGGILEPGETVALCCPSGWTADAWGGDCASSIQPFESGTYSEYCQRMMPLSALGSVYTVGTSVLSDPVLSLHTYPVTESTVPFKTGAGYWPTDLGEVAIIRKFHPVAMIHKEEDVKEAKETESGGSGDSEDADDDNAASAITGARFAPVVAVVVSMLVGGGMLLF
ncbi:hypothetical protein FLAG1_10639 [Fusarium langsethiae]|uniref:Uncharacterized protein n=1 Tax=Fusarium langsethiae TaxID=179993 RepID=A0A0N0DBC5_FUSLA|nr:hypothetical protein FLAG1_10639 [Fusarium langsethiae]GKU07745.1 unnamed protein product [Fusarium langsethiae]GKU23091.1 unnamed protein product [Fusarium langsethiae]